MPAFRACSSPGASGRLEMTTAMRASSRPSSDARISACMLLPRPEIRMPIDWRGRAAMELSVSDTGAVLNLSDAQRARLAGAGQHVDHRTRVVGPADHDQADPHVEGAQHV